MPETFQEHPFITHLKKLTEDRGALAALRRGLGQPPGLAVEMYPYVVRWLPEKVGANEESAYYLTASLFAFHPEATNTGNIGDHLLAATLNTTQFDAVERRFVALLKTHPEDLYFYLRQIMSILKSKGIPINWSQLLRDIGYWDHPNRFVQRRWAASFWGNAGSSQETTQL